LYRYISDKTVTKRMNDVIKAHRNDDKNSDNGDGGEESNGNSNSKSGAKRDF
jgi:hypothetical protein